MASLSGPLQAQQGTSSLPKPDLPVAPEEEILFEAGDVSPSGSACHQTRVHSVGHHSGEPTEGEIGLIHPGKRGHTSRQPLWDRDGRPVLAPPGPLVKSTSTSAGNKSRPPPSASFGKSVDEVGAGPVDTPPPPDVPGQGFAAPLEPHLPHLRGVHLMQMLLRCPRTPFCASRGSHRTTWLRLTPPGRLPLLDQLPQPGSTWTRIRANKRGWAIMALLLSLQICR